VSVNIFIDIETLPCSAPKVIAEIHAAIKPPGNLKKAETIASWWETEGEQAKADAVAKTSFDGLYGRIACICYAFDEGEVFACANANEAQMLIEFYSHVYDQTTSAINGRLVGISATLVGHNLAGFDLPFLKHRSIINGVKPPPAILAAMNAKPWDNKCVADTMMMWNPEREKRVSMDKLCKALGILGKGDFDGSMVAATWPTDPQKVVDYCKGDVERTREIYRRLKWGE
jgi:hypothetical protein